MNLADRPAAPSVQEEASRYALLRRLMPTLRHHMAGEFQPVGMLAALLERRLQQAQPDMAGVKDNCASIGHLSRQAAQTCVDLLGWVAPRSDSGVPAGQAIAECVQLLATSLRFRGFAVQGPSGDLSVPVSSTAMRSVLPAAMLALTDASAQPGDLQVQAWHADGQVWVELTLQAADRSDDNGSATDYRRLSWDDVQALAQAERVGLTRTADTVRLTLASLNS